MRYLFTTRVRVGGGNYADLGTFQGLSTASLALGVLEQEVAVPHSHIWTMDTFEGTGVRAKFTAEDGSLEHVRNRLKNLELTEPVSFVQGKFTDSVGLFKDNFFDFMFIDGSHDYDSVREDFDNWAPKMRKGGELAFHDSNIKSHNKQVWKLMEEMESGKEGNWEKVAVERTLTAWIKRF